MQSSNSKGKLEEKHEILEGLLHMIDEKEMDEEKHE